MTSSREDTAPSGRALAPTGGRGPVVLGVVAFWTAGALLYFLGDVALLDAILLALILAVFPAFAVAQASILQETPFPRLPAYWSSIATLWVLGATAWLAGVRDGGPSAIGVVWIPLLELLGWTVGLAAIGIGVMLGSRMVGRALGIRETPVLERLLPRTRREKRVFVLLSFAAGVGEEVAYRGYALTVLGASIGTGVGVLVSSVVFGVLHAYQGPIGVVRTGVMGAVLAAGFLLSGSLIPAVLAHVVIDLVGGLVIAHHFLDEEPPIRPSLAETTGDADE